MRLASNAPNASGHDAHRLRLRKTWVRKTWGERAGFATRKMLAFDRR
jgi:hypothetical protein